MLITHFSKLVHLQAARIGDRIAFRHKDETSGDWIPTTWKDFSAKVMKVAKAMAAFGIQEHDCIATYTQNKPEGLIVDFAAYGNRAVVTPLYATSSVSQIEYILTDCRAKLIFVGEQFQYDNAYEALRNTPTQKIVIFDSNVKLKPGDDDSIFLDEFMKEGQDDATDTLVRQRMEDAKFTDLANLIYTSGTTGEPKGVMLVHSNFIAAIRSHRDRLSFRDDDSSMCFLPLAHIFERAWSYFCLAKAIRLEINLRPQEVQKSLRETNPSIMCAVPRFWEKVYTAIMDKRERSGKMIQKMMDSAFEVGRKYNIEYVYEGKKAPFLLSLRYKFYDKMVLSKIRLVAGLSNANFFPCAGAALSRNINEFMHSIGVNIVYGYGLTETTATVCCFPRFGYDYATMGEVMPGTAVRIGENNEILVKGDGVMVGYYNKPEETERAFTEDGYFRTGDAGGLTLDDCVFMTERIKDLFKTSNGKYIAPQALETRIGEDPYIEQIAVIGDQRKFVSALIVPDYGLLKEYADKNKIAYTDMKDLVSKPEIYDFIMKRIEEKQSNFASFEHVKRFTIMPEPFSMENGELTNTLKIRRMAINQRYKDLIEAMYAR